MPAASKQATGWDAQSSPPGRPRERPAPVTRGARTKAPSRSRPAAGSASVGRSSRARRHGPREPFRRRDTARFVSTKRNRFGESGHNARPASAGVRSCGVPKAERCALFVLAGGRPLRRRSNGRCGLRLLDGDWPLAGEGANAASARRTPAAREDRAACHLCASSRGSLGRLAGVQAVPVTAWPLTALSGSDVNEAQPVVRLDGRDADWRARRHVLPRPRERPVLQLRQSKRAVPGSSAAYSSGEGRAA